MSKCTGCEMGMSTGANFCSQCGAAYAPQVIEEVDERRTTKNKLETNMHYKTSAPLKFTNNYKTALVIIATTILSIIAFAGCSPKKTSTPPVQNVPQTNTATQSNTVKQVKSGISAAGQEITANLTWEPLNELDRVHTTNKIHIGVEQDGIYFWRTFFDGNDSYILDCFRFMREGSMEPVSIENCPIKTFYKFGEIEGQRKQLAESINKTAGKQIFAPGGEALPEKYSEKAGLYLNYGEGDGFTITDIKTGKKYEVNWYQSRPKEKAYGYVFDNEGHLWVYLYNINQKKEYLVLYGYNQKSDVFQEIGERFEVTPRFYGESSNSHSEILFCALPNEKGVVICKIYLVQKNSQVQLWDYRIRINHYYWQS